MTNPVSDAYTMLVTNELQTKLYDNIQYTTLP